MTPTHRSKATAGIIALLLVSSGIGTACGSTDGGAAKAAEETGAIQESKPRLEPCKLLTEAQVKSVVPDLAGSMVASNGESLMKTVETYQCSHINASAEGLLVIVNIAADAASFNQIKGNERQVDAPKKLDIGDASWLYPKDGGLAVTVHRGVRLSICT